MVRSVIVNDDSNTRSLSYGAKRVLTLVALRMGLQMRGAHRK
jgi:hypothetical protein